MNCYILLTLLLVTMLLFIIVIICYHYTKYRSKQYKMEKNKFKKVGLKNCTCYYFDDITKIRDFDFNNILLDEKSYENTLIYGVSYKILIGAKPFRIKFDKVNGFIRDYCGIKYLALLGSEKNNVIFKTIKFLVRLETNTSYVISHNYEKTKLI